MKLFSFGLLMKAVLNGKAFFALLETGWRQEDVCGGGRKGQRQRQREGGGVISLYIKN